MATKKELWHADIIVTESLVAACIRQQFSRAIDLQSIKFLSSGWDNDVYLVNNKIIFRFPRRKLSVAMLERENIVLPKLQDRFVLEIPRLKYIGKPSELYPYPFHGYNIITGSPSYLVNLTLAQREASIIPLAKFLRKLHGISCDAAEKLGASHQILDRLNSKLLLKNLTERSGKIVSSGIYNINEKYIARLVSVIKNINLSSKDFCLIHGDLYFRHLLFSKHKTLIAIIDWGDIGINNPAVDLAVVYSFYPKSCHQKFIEHYGAVDNNIWRYAEVLGFYSTISILLYAHDVNNKVLFNEAMQSVSYFDKYIF